MKASDLLVRCLENENITHIFGLPGEENADFLISLEKSKSIEFVLCRHEQAAAFMAEVYGRLTGNPAICLGTLGPGATNLVTGVADANMDRAPLIALTGQGSTDRLHKESHQVMDVVNLYEPITKWAHSIHFASAIPEITRKAVRLARTEKPGAVHLELPEDVAKHEAEGDPLPVRRFRRPGCDDKIADQAFDLLQRAKRPIIIAGNGTIRKRASKQLRKFCEMTGIGAISTFMAKGAVDVDADYCLHTIGLQARDFPAVAVDESDLVICIGYDLVEYPPRLWHTNDETPIMHIDFLPAEIDAEYHPEIELVGDIAHNLWALNDRLERYGVPAFDLERQRDLRCEMQTDLATYKDDRTEGLIRPQKALWDIREALGPNDILLSGVGAHKMWVARHYHCHQPNTCIIPNGFCSMGIPLAGSIAADIVIRNQLDGGSPDRNVFALAGDGDFLMNVQEMETAARLESNINIMVWEDHDYGLISWKQQREFGHHTDMTFGNPDWLQLAASFGWQGQYIENSGALAAGIEKALAHDGPSLIVIPIDYRENEKMTDRLGEIQCAI